MKQSRISQPQARRTDSLADHSAEWKDVAGIFAHASPAVKEALRLMREARYAD